MKWLEDEIEKWKETNKLGDRMKVELRKAGRFGEDRVAEKVDLIGWKGQTRSG
jgi:hypothetical protein